MSDEAEYTMGLERQLQELRAELSALRAAQLLTKEKIDSLIDERINEPHLSTWAAGAWDLRDALLDSLADGETK